MPDWYSEVGPIRFRFEGNLKVAYKHIPKARSLALQLRNRLITMEVDVNQYERLELEDAVIQVHSYGTQMIATIYGLSVSTESETTTKKDEPTKKSVLWVGAYVRPESLAGQNTDAYGSASDSYYFDENFVEHYQDFSSTRTDSKTFPYNGSPSSTTYGSWAYTFGTNSTIQWVPFINIVVCEPDWTNPDNNHTIMQAAVPLAVDYGFESQCNKTGAALTNVADYISYTVSGSYVQGPHVVNSGPGFLTYTIGTGVSVSPTGSYSDCAGNNYNAGYVVDYSTTPTPVYVDTNAYDVFASPGYNYWAEAIHTIPATTRTTGGSWDIPVGSSATPNGMYTLACVPHILNPGVNVHTAVSLIPDDKAKTIADLTNTFYINATTFIGNNTYFWPIIFDVGSTNYHWSVSYSDSFGLSTNIFTKSVYDSVTGCNPIGNPVYGVTYTNGSVAAYKNYTSSQSYISVDPNTVSSTFTHQSLGTILPGEYKIYIQASSDYMVSDVQCTVDLYIQLDEKKDPEKFTVDLTSIETRFRSGKFFYNTSAAGALPGTEYGWYAGHWVVDVEKQTIQHVVPTP